MAWPGPGKRSKSRGVGETGQGKRRWSRGVGQHSRGENVTQVGVRRHGSSIRVNPGADGMAGHRGRQGKGGVVSTVWQGLAGTRSAQPVSGNRLASNGMASRTAWSSESWSVSKGGTNKLGRVRREVRNGVGKLVSEVGAARSVGWPVSEFSGAAGRRCGAVDLALIGKHQVSRASAFAHIASCSSVFYPSYARAAGS